MRPKYGDRVNITLVCASYKSQGNKIWRVHKKSHENCIFLGQRTVQEGKIDWDEECGSMFFPDRYYTVALISINSRLNPIYAPIYAVKRKVGNQMEEINYDYKILCEPLDVAQKLLNQWRHMYDLEILSTHDDAQIITMVIRRIRRDGV